MNNEPNKPGQPAAGAAGPAAGQIADVVVDVTNGEFLSYRVEVEGANPKFEFSCEHRDSILESQNFPGHPKAVYEWDLFKQPPRPGRTSVPADDRPLDAYVVTMLFVAARKYVIKIDHHQPGGAVAAVSSRTFESDDPEQIEQSTTVIEIR